ncbi:Follicle-stimulating hormone receptor [Aphelenchoides besseyi]|nr:Follicle-stimulating hormone receptor [Aphelenchoides besseyi]
MDVQWSARLFVASFFLFVVQSISVQTQNQLSDQLYFEKSCRLALRYNECRCAYKAAGTRCCCVGEQITEIPQDLPERLTTFFFYNTSITRLQFDSFRRYLNLEKVHIDTSRHLKVVNASTFEQLRKLRKIFISNCPELTTIAGTLLHHNHRLQSVIIRKNSLDVLPKLEMNEHHNLPLDLLDLSGNRFVSIPTGGLRAVFAQEVDFSRNRIQKIESTAFPKCQFIKLYVDRCLIQQPSFRNLSDNFALSNISTDAFADVLSLTKLDLSGSQLTELPTIGLKQLKSLKLKRVPTLKRLPSVLAFTQLNTAEFTYPYHCCFFKYATREYERGNDKEFQGHYKEIQQRTCNRVNADDYFLRRRKRFENPEVEFGDLGWWLDQFADKMPNITEEENQPYSGDELGKSMILKKCVDTAVANFYMNITCSPEPNELNPCEDIVSYPTLRFFLWPMWIIAIWGEHFGLGDHCGRLETSFALSLFFHVKLVGVYLAFLAFADWKTRNEYYNYAVEWQTGWGCKMAGFINVFASELSIVSMLMIAFEIYYNARFAFYGRRFNSWAAYGAVSFGYAYALLMAALPLFGVSSYEVSSICLPLSISSVTDRIYLIVGLTMTGFAFLGMIVSYILINCMLREQGSPAKTEDKQIFFRTLILIGADILCWMPTLFFGLTAAAGLPLITLTNAKICLILFYPINSCANPILYVFLTRIWKDDQWHMLEKKAPFLEKISKSKSDKTQSQVNRFYYLQAPGNRDERAQSSPDNEDVTRLLVTQSTSLNSTPRGSSSSSPLVRSNGDLVSNSFLSSEPKRLSRASFQEGIDFAIGIDKKRKSIPSLPIFRLRISAIPEMSDISESNSSNSAEDYERRQKQRKTETSKLAANPLVRHNRRTQSGSNLPPVCESPVQTLSRNEENGCEDSDRGILIHDQSHGTSTPRIYFTPHNDEDDNETTKETE